MLRAIVFSLLVVMVAGCGFHLRGHNIGERPFPFTTLYVKAPSPTPFVAELQNNLELYKIKLASSSTTADLTLEIAYERSGKQVLALSSTGQVQEYQLDYTVSFRAYDKQLQDWISADEISLQRNLIYDAAQALAKEQEEQLLFRDMRSDAVQQVLRRLSRAKPRLEKKPDNLNGNGTTSDTAPPANAPDSKPQP